MNETVAATRHAEASPSVQPADTAPPTTEPTAPDRFNLAAELRWAVNQGVSLPALLGDIFRLRRGVGQVTNEEYLSWQLWRSAAERTSDNPAIQPIPHLGAKAAARWLQTPEWVGATDDRILLHLLGKGARIPTPDIVATIGGGRSAAGAAVLADEAAASRWLRERAVYPLTMRPAAGSSNGHTIVAGKLDRKTDTLVGWGRSIGVDEAARMMAAEPRGYTVERQLRPHPATSQIAGRAVCQIRFMIIMAGGSPTIAYATLTASQPDGGARSKTMLACDVDQDDGLIRRSVVGRGMGLQLHGPSPLTGRAMTGLRVPDWSRTRTVVIAAAQTMPSLPVQSWDVAITRDGPAALGVTPFADVELAQRASGRGALNVAVRDLMRRAGWRG